MAKTTRREHIRTLERRRDYLGQFLNDTGKARDFIRAEYYSLCWAIDLLREMFSIYEDLSKHEKASNNIPN